MRYLRGGKPWCHFAGWVTWYGPFMVTTLGGGFAINMHARPDPATGGLHALAYRPDRIGD